MVKQSRSFLIGLWLFTVVAAVCVFEAGSGYLGGLLCNLAGIATVAVAPPRKGCPARRALVGVVGALLCSLAGVFLAMAIFAVLP